MGGCVDVCGGELLVLVGLMLGGLCLWEDGAVLDSRTDTSRRGLEQRHRLDEEPSAAECVRGRSVAGVGIWGQA